jgi:hypothetical protein
MPPPSTATVHKIHIQQQATGSSYAGVGARSGIKEHLSHGRSDVAGKGPSQRRVATRSSGSSLCGSTDTARPSQGHNTARHIDWFAILRRLHPPSVPTDARQRRSQQLTGTPSVDTVIQGANAR